MSFLFEKKSGRNGPYCAVAGYEGNVRYLTVPAEYEGLPVEEISDHAFSGREDVGEVRLPDTIRKLGRFCFYDCGHLKRIFLSDSVDDYYDGVIRECRGLQKIEIRVRRGSYRVLKEMLEDNRETLHFRLLIGESEEEVLLTIPPYHDEDREDTMARAIHPKIVGAGYAYRQTVTRTGVDYREYDSLFSKAEADDLQAAADIALDRLEAPHELREEDREKYQTFLQTHAEAVLTRIISSGGTERLGALLRVTELPAEAVDKGLQQAAEAGRTEMTGQLMEYSRCHKHAGGGMEVFTL